MSLAARVSASIVALQLSACCSGMSGGAPSPAPERPAGCLALCERVLACHFEMGTLPRVADGDCVTACAPDGVYGSLAAEAWACSDRDECSDVWACFQSDMAAAQFAADDTAGVPDAIPDDWPADFPRVPGGTPVRAPPMGPVHVAVLGYVGRPVVDLAREYVSLLEAAEWSIPLGTREHEEGAERFIARRGSDSVSVSIYREGEETYVQTMQLGALFAE